MEKIRSMVNRIKNTFVEIHDSVSHGRAEVKYYKDLWDLPEGKAAVCKTLEQLKYLLKKIKPSKIEGNVIFGTGDPASTGQMIGLIAVLYGTIPEKLEIIPDFEEKKYEGTVLFRGKIRLVYALIVAGRLLLDKNFRYIVKELFAKEGAENE